MGTLAAQTRPNPEPETSNPKLLNPKPCEEADLGKLAAGIGKDAALPGMTVPGVWVDTV